MLEEIAPDLFLQRHPLRMAGCKMGRVVSLIRLSSGRVVVHSTAKFTREHLDEITEVGDPGWMVEATLFHDTCAAAGRAAFIDLPYLVPMGFKNSTALEASSLATPPDEWDDELEVIEIKGAPKLREHAVFHRPSKTLIVADLLFNLPPEAGKWTQLFLRATGGIHEFPGMSRLLRFLIKDRAAFASSIQQIAELDFDRIVVGHGEPIVNDAKNVFLKVMAKHGLTG